MQRLRGQGREQHRKQIPFYSPARRAAVSIIFWRLAAQETTSISIADAHTQSLAYLHCCCSSSSVTSWLDRYPISDHTHTHAWWAISFSLNTKTQHTRITFREPRKTVQCVSPRNNNITRAPLWHSTAIDLTHFSIELWLSLERSRISQSINHKYGTRTVQGFGRTWNSFGFLYTTMKLICLDRTMVCQWDNYCILHGVSGDGGDF